MAQQIYFAMKKFFLLLTTIGMMMTTAVSQNLDNTITFMNCIQCEDYFELEVNVDTLVNLILSCNTVPETNDLFGIRTKFYEEFQEETLPGVTGIFLKYQDNFDTLSFMIRKALTGETLAIYVATKFGWLMSVDMQEFYAFDRSLLISKYGNFYEYSPFLRKEEILR